MNMIELQRAIITGHKAISATKMGKLKDEVNKCLGEQSAKVFEISYHAEGRMFYPTHSRKSIWHDVLLTSLRLCDGMEIEDYDNGAVTVNLGAIC